MPNGSNLDRSPDIAKPRDQVRWVRSDEARKLLKLSTCDLAHAREAGRIPFKKLGNAYLYRIDGTESADPKSYSDDGKQVARIEITRTMPYSGQER